MRRLTATIALAWLLGAACADDSTRVAAADPAADEYYAVPRTLPEGWMTVAVVHPNDDAHPTFGGALLLTADDGAKIRVDTRWPGRPDDSGVSGDGPARNLVQIPGVGEVDVQLPFPPRFGATWSLTAGTRTEVWGDADWTIDDEPPSDILLLMQSIDAVDQETWEATIEGLPDEP